MWVKICGIRDDETASAVAQLGASALGLNFFPGSRRCVSYAAAERVAERVSASVETVGVFVNASCEQVIETAGRFRLTGVQLHGDESPALVAVMRQALPRVRLIRARRVAAGGMDLVARDLEELRRLNAEPDACLIDACVAAEYGGTGQQPPWQELADVWRREWPPLILAGGLTPANVAEAIRTVRPWGVDVASGVESAPGVKSLELVERFIRAVSEGGRTSDEGCGTDEG